MSQLTTDRKRIGTLFTAREIAGRVRQLADEIIAELGPDFVMVSILKGSFVFAADLGRALHEAGAMPDVDFITLSSYGEGTSSSGDVHIVRDIDVQVKDRNILIVDDILESGRTLALAVDLMTARGGRLVRTCVLLEKPGKRAVQVAADFVGFPCPDHFVIGYGMDMAHAFRELPFIGYMTD